ncbi:NAD(P)-binding protein [Annulohypoxylon bovei var. microspora]|nr:NAD(P)-binding protein [Annulohypoxylon bovei var. microspora]
MTSSGYTPVGQYTQLFPPKPGFTEKDLPDLFGKVYIVTGANAGIGKELSRILYSKRAEVYMAGRSKQKIVDAIRDIKNMISASDVGQLVFLHLDLANLVTIKASAERFLERENRLDVLWNNAGVMNPPEGSETEQGYELQLGVNCIGTFLFTRLLTPTLIKTTKLEVAGAVRVVWVSSQAIESTWAIREGIDMDNLDYHEGIPSMTKYCISKTGSMFYGTEYAKRHAADGILSVPLNPGLIDTNLWHAQGKLSHAFLRMFILHPTVFGAYTELFGGLSPEVTLEKSGQWVIPWGRFQSLRKDLVAGSRSTSEPGGTGTAERFWDWSEEQVRSYL